MGTLLRPQQAINAVFLDNYNQKTSFHVRELRTRQVRNSKATTRPKRALDRSNDMSTTHYETELSHLAATYEAAMKTDVSRIKEAIAEASDFSVIGVGSGGSFTVASLLCNLHEAYTGRVSRPSTPLEIICNPTLASASPLFLFSAEGKNPDVVEALKRARTRTVLALHVITNRASSPLIDCGAHLTDVNTHVFELRQKDGYLATNSLLLNSVLVARAYGELNNDEQTLPASIDKIRLDRQPICEWLTGAESFAEAAAKRGNVIVIFSPLLRPIATDLESKLSESALLHCQLTDLRSFAHGRHLWLAERAHDCTILALVEPSLAPLWRDMESLLPGTVPI